MVYTRQFSKDFKERENDIWVTDSINKASRDYAYRWQERNQFPKFLSYLAKNDYTDKNTHSDEEKKEIQKYRSTRVRVYRKKLKVFKELLSI